MSLKIYNTLSREKESFKTHEPGVVRMYVCGPTVYDSAHVGHAMSSIVFDIIRRYLEYRGFQVLHVMNYTDVDDKVIQRANELGVEPVTLAADYAEQYDHHLLDLNVLLPTVKPRVSQEIDGIIQMVQDLVKKSFAYEREGDVYFRVAKDPDYGRLSRRKLEDMRAGFRLDVDERKEDPADFALWKAAKEGEPYWESPWGQGRPGWHIECSAMALRHLGEQIDIHGGGNDLIFPHHENEIAQTESITDKNFATYWVHNGMMQIGGEDMSKSQGIMVTIDKFLSEHEADALRMMILNANYRGPITFSDEVVNQAERGLERLRSALRMANPSPTMDAEVGEELLSKVEEVKSGFELAMDDDFNTASALAQLFDFVRVINSARDAGVDEKSLGTAQVILGQFAGILGLQLDEKEQTSKEAEPFIDLLLQIRKELREVKQWELSDLIRTRLEELGITIEDGKGGTTWRIQR
jgi:cysteinyl-tRNA synthetase